MLRTSHNTPLRVALFGGSNSIDRDQAYPRQLLERLHRWNAAPVLHNLAIGATGTLLPSFCASAVLPAVDVVIVETGSNDAITWPEQAIHYNMPPNRPQLNPPAAMERLLRALPASTRVIVFSVCGPGLPENRLLMKRCPTFHMDVAKRYNAYFLDLLRATGPQTRHHVPMNVLFDTVGAGGIHLTQDGNHHAARVLDETLFWMFLDERARHQGIVRSPDHPLPPPLHLDPSWELVDSPWHCRVCTPRTACAHVQPVQPPVGFQTSTREANEWLGWQKYGWETKAMPNATITFDVAGHVLVAFACQGFWRRSSSDAGVALISVGNGHARPKHRLHLNWTQPAHHMCVAEVARHLPPGSKLTIQTDDSAGGSIKVYGIFEQSPPARVPLVSGSRSQTV